MALLLHDRQWTPVPISPELVPTVGEMSAQPVPTLLWKAPPATSFPVVVVAHGAEPGPHCQLSVRVQAHRKGEDGCVRHSDVGGTGAAFSFTE